MINIKKITIAITLFVQLASLRLVAQSGTINMTPVQTIGLQPVTIEVPARFSGLFPENRTINLPPGYKARVYHIGGLTKPRFMSFSPTGVLHVADQNAGKVFALPDLNNDGVADTIISVADGFSVSHDVKFYKGAMYVTNERRVWKLTDTNQDGIYETRTIFIDSIAEGATQPGGGHRTRTIVFDSVNQKAYLSIGSLCNVCREDFRAVIEQYNEDGTGRRIYASGVRNAVGMAVHPKTSRLWANNNGSDRQGNETPPEWIDLVRDGGYYGYPFAYANQVWFNFNAHSDYQALLPITSADSIKVAKMIEPAALIRAHTAPMAITFLNESFPAAMQSGMLMALRGSWNSPQSFRGYSLVYLHLNNANDTTVDYVADFATGFLTDSVTRQFWGRPVGLAINNKGEIFMSSDENTNFVLQLYPEFPVGLNEPEVIDHIEIYPNPAHTLLHIKHEGMNAIIQFQLMDIQGRIAVDAMNNPQMNISNLNEGIYIARVKFANGKTTTQKIAVVR